MFSKAAWNIANKDRIRAYGASYDVRNRDRRRVAARARRAQRTDEDKHRFAEYHRAYKRKHRARALVLQRAWREANREQRRAQVAAYRSRRLKAPGSHTVAEWRALVESFAGRCAYCGTSGSLQLDHV